MHVIRCIVKIVIIYRITAHDAHRKERITSSREGNTKHDTARREQYLRKKGHCIDTGVPTRRMQTQRVGTSDLLCGSGRCAFSLSGVAAGCTSIYTEPILGVMSEMKKR